MIVLTLKHKTITIDSSYIEMAIETDTSLELYYMDGTTDVLTDISEQDMLGIRFRLGDVLTDLRTSPAELYYE